MRSITVRRVLSSILLPVYLSSCTSWQVQSVSPEQAITEDQPSKIRVTLSDSSRVEMEQPRIVGDTVRGLVSGGQQDILLANISRMELKRGDALKTVGLVGIVVGAAAAALAILCIIYCEDISS